jgi:hypothetical protein
VTLPAHIFAGETLAKTRHQVRFKVVTKMNEQSGFQEPILERYAVLQLFEINNKWLIQGLSIGRKIL